MSVYKCEVCGKKEKFDFEIELILYVCGDCVSDPRADHVFEKYRAQYEAVEDWLYEQMSRAGSKVVEHCVDEDEAE
ncbi:MAG: hypothetical protein QXH59_04760 [Candidatus Caldarchaeum sp.]